MNIGIVLKMKLTSLFFLIALFGVSQNLPSTNSVNQLAPHEASLFSYSPISINYYSGMPIISLPIQRIKSNDNDIDISLNYNSAGIGVEQEASIVGLGWVLNPGGVITEQQGVIPPGINQGGACVTISNSTQSYSYSFAGHSGKFVCDNADNGIMFRQEDLQIKKLPGLVTGFKITTPQGYVYLFGSHQWDAGTHSSSWYLTNIYSPTNDIVSFEYVSPTDYDFEGLHGSGELITNFIGHGFVSGVPNNATATLDDADCRTIYSGGVGPDYYPWSSPLDNKPLVKTLYLKKIITTNSIVEFNYQDRYDLNHPGTTLPQCLKEITISSTLNTQLPPVKRISLEYNYSDYNNLNTVQSKRLRLIKITEVGSNGNVNPLYELNYNTINLPLKTSNDQDHWGYYNGPKNNSSIYPVNGANRSPDPTYTVAGMLNSITYATGGQSTFEFESNDYSNKGSANGFTKGGGVRIKRIITTDGVNSTPTIKRFDYTKIVNGTSVSSGKLIYSLSYSVTRGLVNYEHLCYGHYQEYSTLCNCMVNKNFTAVGVINTSYVSNYSHPMQLGNLDLGPAVCYDNVTVFDDGNTNLGKTAYEYINSECSAWGLGSYITGSLTQPAPPQNGSLKTTTIYSFNTADNLYYPLKVEENEIETVNSKDIEYFTQRNFFNYAPNLINQCPQSNYDKASIQSYWVRSKSQTITEFKLNTNNISITNKNIYTYKYTSNPKSFAIAKTETVNSKNENLVVEFKYPEDYPTAPYDEMTSRNIISPVIEQTQINTTLNKELGKMKTNYSFWQNNSIIQPATIQKSKYGYALKTDITINDYDNKGNMLQMSSKDGIITSYIWGYNQQYPVAKVIGTSYSNAVSQSGIVLGNLTNPSTDNALRTELNKLRTMNNVMVTTYTYKPLVGITSETDANGKTIYYEYDAFNRLILIRDKDNKILKKICYNYAGEPENCYCNTTTPDWQGTGNYRCIKDGNNINTGYQEREEKDMNPCNFQTRWVIDGYNPTACPSCTYSTCQSQGEAYVCVAGHCEEGYRVNTNSIYYPMWGMYECVYHYEYADGSWSQDYSSFDYNPCPI